MEFGKSSRFAILSALLIIIMWCAWLWRPEHQIRLHQLHFLRAFEERDWKDIAGFLDDEYADRWGHDKAFVLREGREVFRQFLWLTVAGEIVRADVSGDAAQVEARVRLAGRGSPIAEMAIERANALNAPFVFEWKRRSWKPWDWRMTRLDQPELEIPEMGGF